MNPAFWDTSSLLPLCVRQQSSPLSEQLSKQYSIVTWWATSVEMRSGVERLLRLGHISAPQYGDAQRRMAKLQRGWREIGPNEPLRSKAETLLRSNPLKAADALQLAAAWMWSSASPEGHVFISGDARLLETARREGFQTVAA